MGISRELVNFVANEGLGKPSARDTNVRTAVVAASFGVLAAVGFWVDSLWFWAPAWVVMGGLLHSGFAAVHEATHNHLYEAKWANRVAGFVWGATVLSNFSLYRAFHLEHHNKTRVQGDPEPQTEFTAAWQYVLGVPILGFLYCVQFWALSMKALFGSMPAYVRTDRQRRAIKRDAWLILVVTVGLAAAAWTWPGFMLRAWAMPFFFSTVFLTLFTLPEHYGCDSVTDYLRSTRTTLTNPVIRYVFWNNNFHAAHHVYPAVPYNHLVRLHDYTVDATKFVARSYTAFHLGLLRSLWRGQVIDLTTESESEMAAEREPVPTS